MGTSSPSTVTQPFNQAASQQIAQEQAQTGSLATTGQTQQTSAYAPNQLTSDQAIRVALSAGGLQGMWGQPVPGMGVANFAPEQQAALGSIYGTGTNLGALAGVGFGNSLQGAGYAGISGAPLTGQEVAQFYNPMAANVTAQLQNIFGQQNSQATADATKTAGGVGASRIGVAQGNIANQQALAAGQTYAGLYQNALQAAQQQKQQQLQAGTALAGMGGQNIQAGMGGLQAAYGAGSQVQQLEQARLAAQYQQQMQQYQQPFQILAAQLPALQGMGVLGGTTTGTGAQAGTQTGAQFGTLEGTQNSALTGQQSTQYPAPSLLSQITGGALAGLGGLSLLGGSGGALGGISAIGSLFGASDKRAKTDIQRYGSDPQTGDNLYAFRYKGDPKTYPKVIGPMAQDIQKTHPEDVTQLAARGGIIPSGLGRQPVGRFPARMGPEMNFMPRPGHIPKKQGGGSVLPYTQMTSLFSGTPQFHQMQGPGAPQKSELDSITGDIQKYLKLKTLVSGKKPEPFARVPNEPGPTEGGRFEGSSQGQQDQGGGQDSYQGPEAPSQSDYGGGGYGSGYRKGGPVGYQDSGVVEAEPAGLPEYQDQEQPQVEDTAAPDLGPTTVEPAAVPEVNPAQAEDPDIANAARSWATGRGEQVPLPRRAPLPKEGAATTEGLGGLRGGPGGGYGRRGGMGGLAGAGNPVGMSLLSAGLGMLAASGQRDARGLPMNFAGALGQGGLQGLRTYSDQQDAAFKAQQMQAASGRAQAALDESIRWHNLQAGKPMPIGKDFWGNMQYGVRNPQGGFTDLSGKPVDMTQVSGLGEAEGEGKAVDSKIESMANGIANYDMSPPSLRQRTSPVGMAVMERVKQINPDWDEKTWTSAKATKVAFAKGTEGQEIRRFNTYIAHSYTLESALDALERGNLSGDYRRFNQLSQWWARETGSPLPQTFDGIKSIYGNEAVAATVGTRNALGDRQEIGENISTSSSPAALRGIISAHRELAGGRMRSLKNQYEEETKAKDFDKKLLPETQEALQKTQSFGGHTKKPEKGMEGAPAAPKTVSSKKEYDDLPSGATFTGSDGKSYTKP